MQAFMTKVKITFSDGYKMVDVRNIADKYSCKLVHEEGNEVIYEKEDPEGFISVLKIMKEIFPYIQIILLHV
jgi:uncharacterized repeat protein (TIGR04076 family)